MAMTQFDTRMEALTQKLQQMSHDIEELVRIASELVGRPVVDSEEIQLEDDKIDAAEVEIEETAVELLARHHPVASDLRILVAVLKINNDLERIGDHAVNIAQAAERLAKAQSTVPRPPELEEMSRVARAMLRDALDSFLHQNEQEAMAVIREDTRLDRLQESLFRIMLTHMPEHNVSACLQFILIGRNLERIGDLATNICEDVVYLVRGIMIRHQGQGP